MSIKGKAYIAGVFEHPLREIPHLSTAQVHAECAKGALADAGLSKDDVDAYYCAGEMTPLLDESLFLIGSPDLAGMPRGKQVRLKAIGALPLILPSGSHGLRAIVATAFAQAGCEPNIVADIDGLAILMDAVRAGLAATIQPGAASSRLPADALKLVRVTDAGVRRRNLRARLSDDE